MKNCRREFLSVILQQKSLIFNFKLSHLDNIEFLKDYVRIKNFEPKTLLSRTQINKITLQKIDAKNAWNQELFCVLVLLFVFNPGGTFFPYAKIAAILFFTDRECDWLRPSKM